MGKYLLATVMVLVLVAPAGAITWDMAGGSNPQNVPIGATIPEYAQLEWQDMAIDFSSSTCDGGTGDWHRGFSDGCVGQYLHDYDKSSLDPWASGWFESYDGAHIYLASNTNISMGTAANGDLEDGNGHTIDTHFTVAFSGHYYNGFLMGSTWYGYQSIPLNGAGVYGVNADPHMYLATSDVGSNQDCFSMDDGDWDLDLNAVSRGTIEFKARMHRTGLGEWEEIPDAAGTYSTSLDITFTAP